MRNNVYRLDDYRKGKASPPPKNPRPAPLDKPAREPGWPEAFGLAFILSLLGVF